MKKLCTNNDSKLDGTKARAAANTGSTWCESRASQRFSCADKNYY